jgi:hypothetical protein
LNTSLPVKYWASAAWDGFKLLMLYQLRVNNSRISFRIAMILSVLIENTIVRAFPESCYVHVMLSNNICGLNV